MRVVIVGPPGAGKSRLAAALAARSALPLHDLDDLYWGSDWTRPTAGEWRARQRRVTGGDSWIIAGNFQPTLDLRLRRATHVVVVDPGPAVCLWRLMRRTLGIYLGRTQDLPRQLRAAGRMKAGRGITKIARTALRYRRIDLPATRRLADTHRLHPLVVGRAPDLATLLSHLAPQEHGMPSTARTGSRPSPPATTTPEPATALVPPRAVAFDFFGTLGRWQPGTVGSPAQVLYDLAPDRAGMDTRHLVGLVEGQNGTAQSDAPVTAEAYAQWEEQSWRAAADYAQVPLTQDLLARLRAVIDDRRLELFPDVLPALRALHDQGIPWVLCSNASPDVEGKLHDLLEPQLRPRACVVSWRVGARKPHPNMFAAALRALAPLAAAEVLFVGDRYDCDVAGPREHGFRTAFLDRAGDTPLTDADRARTAVWSDLNSLAELVRRPTHTSTKGGEHREH
ncbi:HAD-IA family hydrolase [Streptomyces sp. NPDC050095]|uniref:HAD-IA family hydrolase n=1 Tax=unclassified Streptomyces TaxID=2593676 RepID=UPI0034132198